MKKNKTEKGITLVALIITIIVLLILAVVAIGVVTGDGILFHAKDASTKYAEKAEEENSTLKSYADMIADETGKGPWTQEGMSITDGHISLKVGDKVNYDELSNGEKSYFIDHTRNGGTSTANDQELKTEDLAWRVLGVNEKGLLELISNKPTKNPLFLTKETGYLNAEDILNSTCHALYGKGKYAASGRSLKAEDVNKLANFNPSIAETWQYRFSSESAYMQSRISLDRGKNWSEWTDITDENLQTFKVPGEKEINKSNPGIKELPRTYYSYHVSNKITETTSYHENLADLITKGEEESNYLNQWTASRAIDCYTAYAGFHVRTLYNGDLNGQFLHDTRGNMPAPSYLIRPVVTLEPSVSIGNQIEGIWQLK